MTIADYLKNFIYGRGQSLVEIVIALGLFATIVSGVAQLAMSSMIALENSNHAKKAQILAQSAVEATQAIKNKHWNNIVYGTSSLRLINNFWQLADEGQTETINDFIRTLAFRPVYRTADGATAALSDSGAGLDIFSKDLKVMLSWPNTNNRASSTLEYTTRITAWNAQAWEQADWSGGSGQFYWLDNTRYYFDNDNLAIASSGAVRLKETATSTFVASGYLTSSAYQAAGNGTFIALSWSEVIPDDCPECNVKIQIKTAPDIDDEPGDWTTNWSGPSGEGSGDYYTASSGTLIHNSHNGDSWLRYLLVLTGNGSATPLVTGVKIYYQ